MSEYREMVLKQLYDETNPSEGAGGRPGALAAALEHHLYTIGDTLFDLEKGSGDWDSVSIQIEAAVKTLLAFHARVSDLAFVDLKQALPDVSVDALPRLSLAS